MYTPTVLPVVPTKDKTLILRSSVYTNPNHPASATATDIRFFKKWMRRNGFTAKPTYPYHWHTWMDNRYRTDESIRRASTWTGHGLYEGVSVKLIDRTTLPEDAVTRYRNRGGLDGRGHGRGDGSIIIETDISCFYHNQNLLGWRGITWMDMMAGDFHLLLPWRPSHINGYDRYVLGKAA